MALLLARLKEPEDQGRVADAALLVLGGTTDAALEDLTYKVQQIRLTTPRARRIQDLTDKVCTVHSEMKVIKSMKSELHCIKEMLEESRREDGPP